MYCSDLVKSILKASYIYMRSLIHKGNQENEVAILMWVNFHLTIRKDSNGFGFWLGLPT